MIDRDVPKGALRHGRMEGIVGILHDRDASTILDSPEPGRAIVELAAENDSDDTRSISIGRRSEQDIDRGAKAIFLRSMSDPNIPAFQQEVMVWPVDIEAAGLDGLSIDSVRGRQRTDAGEDDGQDAAARWGHVHDDKHGGRQVGGKTLHQRL